MWLLGDAAGVVAVACENDEAFAFYADFDVVVVLAGSLGDPEPVTDTLRLVRIY